MALAAWFTTFGANIQVNNTTTISSRYKTITKRLNTDFWTTDSDIAHSLYVGSYGRNTAIAGFSDLDMIFDLPISLYAQYNDYTTNGQSALLQAVRQSLQKTYPNTRLGADGQVLEVSFSDGLIFEIVPGFAVNGGFLYPDTNDGGTWPITNPRPEIRAIRERNKECNGNLIRLCRMMRAWKSTWNVPIGGLLIDTLAYQFIEHWGSRDKSYFYYDWMCRDFFEFLSEQNPSQGYWRAPGSGQYVYRKGNFEYKATQCYNISLSAISHETATPKRESSAKKEWRRIFGSKFPG